VCTYEIDADTATDTDDRYWVREYGGDGCDSGATWEGPFDTLQEARVWIEKQLGGRTFGCFDGPFSDDEPDLIECWHNSYEEGCGGFAIYDDSTP
jgi:hypothetical protein